VLYVEHLKARFECPFLGLVFQIVISPTVAVGYPLTMIREAREEAEAG
jgi:hypothetical protein